MRRWAEQGYLKQQVMIISGISFATNMVQPDNPLPAGRSGEGKLNGNAAYFGNR
ncbi:hypothetical protein [Breoghania sp. JC706]|uniref:hypothetical protein n=1 Tax=Breoghania sp. JC706 TaxID=3117732 RepID=UPI00300A9924